MSMGSRISQARKDKGFTQEYVALSLGVSTDFLTSGVQIEDTTPLSVLPLRWVSTVLLLVTLLFLVGAWILALVAHYMNQK